MIASDPGFGIIKIYFRKKNVDEVMSFYLQTEKINLKNSGGKVLPSIRFFPCFGVFDYS